MKDIDVVSSFRRVYAGLSALYPAYLGVGQTASDDSWLEICDLIFRQVVLEPSKDDRRWKHEFVWRQGQYGTWKEAWHFASGVLCVPKRGARMLLAQVSPDHNLPIETRKFVPVTAVPATHSFFFVEFRNPFSDEQDNQAVSGVMGMAKHEGTNYEVFVNLDDCASVLLQVSREGKTYL